MQSRHTMRTFLRWFLSAVIFRNSYCQIRKNHCQIRKNWQSGKKNDQVKLIVPSRLTTYGYYKKFPGGTHGHCCEEFTKARKETRNIEMDTHLYSSSESSKFWLASFWKVWGVTPVSSLNLRWKLDWVVNPHLAATSFMAIAEASVLLSNFFASLIR